jgi:hypothetical protein
MPNPSHRIWRIAAWTAAGLALASVGAWMLWDRGSRRALDAATARMEAAGMPRDFARLDAWLDQHFGPIPSGANGAPALRAALALAQELEDRLPLRVPEFGAAEPPAVDDAARRLVEEAADLFAKLGDALGRERYRFEVAWERGLEAETPIGFGYGQTFEFLMLRAAVHVADGDLDAALADVRAQVALGESLREFPRPLEQLLRIGSRNAADLALRTILVRTDDPRGALAAAGIEPVVDGIRQALRTEAAFVRHATSDLLEGASRESLGGLLLPSLRGDLADLIEVLVTTCELASDPTPEDLTGIDALETAYAERAGLLGRLLATRSGFLIRLELEQRAQLMLTAAGADALAFHDRERRWPRAEELASRPTDPLSGAELTATLDGDALILRLGEAEWRLERRD